MFKRLFFMAFLLAAICSSTQGGEYYPIQLSVFGLLPQKSEVRGLRLNIPYGKNEYVAGLDLGIWGRAANGSGFQLNLVNDISGTYRGLQLGLVNMAGATKGLQLGLVNIAQEIHGLQLGLLNIVKGSSNSVFPGIQGRY